MNDTTLNDQITELPLLTETSAAELNDKQQLVYRDHREKLARWALTMGKQPRKARGYAFETVKQRLFRLDKFYRFVWDVRDRFTVEVDPTDADEWMRQLAKTDNSETYNAACQKAVKMLFKWREDEYNEPMEWEPVISFSSNTSGTARRHYFAVDTLKQLMDASLEFESLPSYSNVSPEKRDEINQYLAMRLGKPKAEIGPDDWEKADSWKVAAMIHLTVDAGLRDKEVGTAKVSWIDWDAKALRIPGDQAVKSSEPWEAALRSQTLLILRKWLDERAVYDKYAGRDELFLTRYVNQYRQKALNRLLRRLCDFADVDGSDATWYSIRRSLVTHLQQQAGYKATQMQARHKSPETTMGYDQAPLDMRREALERTFG